MSAEAPAWAAALPADVAERLARLNPPAYLSHKRSTIEAHRARAEKLPARWDAVEIGSNRGAFSQGLAQSHPDWAVLALEWRGKWVRRAAARSAAEGLRGLHTVRADARVALPLLAAPGSIERLFVLYPDPWWKAKHERRRLLDPAFFEVASELLAPSGLLAIKTDVRAVRDEVVAAAEPVATLRPLLPSEWPDERAWPMSTRERTCLRDGVATYRLFWRRGSGSLPEHLDARHDR